MAFRPWPIFVDDQITEGQRSIVEDSDVPARWGWDNSDSGNDADNDSVGWGDSDNDDDADDDSVGSYDSLPWLLDYQVWGRGALGPWAGDDSDNNSEGSYDSLLDYWQQGWGHEGGGILHDLTWRTYALIAHSTTSKTIHTGRSLPAQWIDTYEFHSPPVRRECYELGTAVGVLFSSRTLFSSRPLRTSFDSALTGLERYGERGALEHFFREGVWAGPWSGRRQVIEDADQLPRADASIRFPGSWSFGPDKSFSRWMRSGTSTPASFGAAYVWAPAQDEEGGDTLLHASGNLAYIQPRLLGRSFLAEVGYYLDDATINFHPRTASIILRRMGVLFHPWTIDRGAARLNMGF